MLLPNVSPLINEFRTRSVDAPIQGEGCFRNVVQRRGRQIASRSAGLFFVWSGLIVVIDPDSHPRSNQWMPTFAWWSDPELPSRLTHCRGKARTWCLVELDTVLDPVFRECLAGNQTKTLNSVFWKIAGEFCVARFACPLGGIKRFTIWSSSDDFTVTCAA